MVRGLGPGLLATVAAGLTTDYFFLDPKGTVSGFSLETVPLLLFFLEGTLVCLLAEALRAARSRAEGSKLQAERHQERLRRSEEHFRSLVESMRDYAIFMLDPGGRVASWNAGAESLEGYRAEEIIGEHFSVFFTEEDARVGKPERNLEAAAGEGRFVEENWLVRRDGSWFWAGTILTALHDDEGKLRGFSEVMQDITEKKETERLLEEAENRLRTLVEHVPAITYTGEVGDHALAYVSPQIEEVLGYSPGEVMADPDHWTKMLHPHDRRWVLAEERRTAETGDPLVLEYRMFARNGHVVWLHDEATLVRDEEGNPLRWQGFMLDVTKRKKAEEKLRESEELYRNVVEQAAENIFLLDPYTKHILQANASFHHSLGFEAEELRRLTLYDILAHDQESIDRNVQRVLDEGRHFIGERRYRRKDDSLINVEVSAGAIAYGGRPALCVVAHDVTQRKMAEEALRRSLDALLALYETGQILSSSLEREEIGSRLLEVVRRVSNLTAAVISIPDEKGELSIWRSSGLDGLWRQTRFDPEALSAHRKVLETGEHQLLRLRRPEDPQEERNLVSMNLPLLVRDRVIGVLEAYGTDALGESGAENLYSLANQGASALENARLYAELAERENQLRRLVEKLIMAQEEERRRVAYDVHDGLAQTAAAAHQHLQAFARHNPPGSAKSRDELDEALQLVRDVVGEARQVIHDLRPTVLDDYGLAAAVRLQVQRLRSEGLEVSLEEALGDERLPPEVETTLFRVAQEALTNVRKHSRASRVRVVLDRSGSIVRLLVRDEGRGFKPDEVAKSNGPGERFGLSGMRERVSLLGGSFKLHSEPGSGTTVKAEVELPEIREDYEHTG